MVVGPQALITSAKSATAATIMDLFFIVLNSLIEMILLMLDGRHGWQKVPAAGPGCNLRNTPDRVWLSQECLTQRTSGNANAAKERISRILRRYLLHSTIGVTPALAPHSP